MAGPATRPTTGAANTADQSPLAQLDNAAYIAMLKRCGLREDEAVSVLLHEGRIHPVGAGRARRMYSDAPPPPSYGGAP